MKTETLMEAAKASPPLAVGGLTLFGIQLSDWVLLGSALYTTFLLIDKTPTVVERIGSLVDWIKAKIK